MASLLDDFAAATLRHPEQVAIVDGKGRETTFAQLKSRADGLARAWGAQGIGKGDRVLLAMHLDADLYASLAALWSLGATVVLPEPAMGLAGLRHAAKVAGVTAFCSSGLYGVLKLALPELWSLRHLRPRIKPDAPFVGVSPSADDIALISFTSGTTGAPKAIPRSHGFLSAQHHAIAPLLASPVPERDLVAFPVFVLINIASGQTSVLPNWKMSRLRKLKAATLAQWMTRQKVTRALIPPALCEKLAKTGIPASLHTVFTGGGPVFPDMLDALRAAKPGVEMICVYGSTEAEPIAYLDAKDITQDDLAKMQAGGGLLVGHPVENLGIRIVAGEIQVSGAHVNGGYLDPRHDAENKTHDDGAIWHHTGDAGALDPQDRLWLLGRVGTDVVIHGRRLFPFSVEVAARGWEGVTQCALIGTKTGACLVIEGNADHMAAWAARAASFGALQVKHVAKIPMDKRHGSKVDRIALGLNQRTR
ncbi:AMP-binding protein [Thioclava sp.]|uniref:AMP-binding protein n=1 Tax=Thioclava sp. TaxID=1933450 RepID=UPI003AA90E12